MELQQGWWDVSGASLASLCCHGPSCPALFGERDYNFYSGSNVAENCSECDG